MLLAVRPRGGRGAPAAAGMRRPRHPFCPPPALPAPRRAPARPARRLSPASSARPAPARVLAAPCWLPVLAASCWPPRPGGHSRRLRVAVRDSDQRL